MPTDDRDQLFQRALARHLSDASPDSACPDAELLAAYHDRTLSLDEIAHWKQHIATCPRCQEILALVEQTENLPVEDWQNQGVFESVVGAAIAKGASAPRSTVLPASTIASAAPVCCAPRRRHTGCEIAPLASARSYWSYCGGVIVFVGVREIRQHHAQQLATTQIAENRSRCLTAHLASTLRAHETGPARATRQPPLPTRVRPSKPLSAGAPGSRQSPKSSSASRAQSSLNNDLSAAKRKDTYPTLSAPPPALLLLPVTSRECAKRIRDRSGDASEALRPLFLLRKRKPRTKSCNLLRPRNKCRCRPPPRNSMPPFPRRRSPLNNEMQRLF